MKKDPKAIMGHPDPQHPTNKYTGDDAALVDYHGNPVVQGLPWGQSGTGLYLYIIIQEGTGEVPAPEAVVGAKEPSWASWAVGGCRFVVGCTEGRPRFPGGAFGNCLELPSDLGRDPDKQALVMDWLRDMAVECLHEAKAAMGFTKLPGDGSRLGVFLQGAANRCIGRMGL